MTTSKRKVWFAFVVIAFHAAVTFTAPRPVANEVGDVAKAVDVSALVVD